MILFSWKLGISSGYIKGLGQQIRINRQDGLIIILAGLQDGNTPIGIATRSNHGVHNGE